MKFIEIVERTVDQSAIKNFLSMQPGDVPATYADVDDLIQAVGFKPQMPLEVGIERFIRWYRDFYDVSLAA
jgi:UDP-glucuronate 4-epimerase